MTATILFLTGSAAGLDIKDVMSDIIGNDQIRFANNLKKYG
jgi:hypothetical protein